MQEMSSFGSGDIFSKLSRVLETNDFQQDEEQEVQDTGNDFSPSKSLTLNDLNRLNNLAEGDDIYELLGIKKEAFGSKEYDHTQSLRKTDMHVSKKDFGSPSSKPTPYQVWKAKQDNYVPRKTPKLNGQQWDKLVDKMYRSNKVRANAVRDQNASLALELGEHAFRPTINKKSLEAVATMKSLQERMPELKEKREKLLEAERKKNFELDQLECTFAPKREGREKSDTYLRKSGREKQTPDGLIHYAEEKAKRIELRKKIVTEIEDKELTFKPQIGQKSQQLQEKYIKKHGIAIDPVTRVAIVPPSPLRKSHGHGPPQIPLSNANVNEEEDTHTQLPEPLKNHTEAPALVIESEHPYKHNISEYTTVQVPGAVSYSITFDPASKTEAIFDYIKFYDDESHTAHYGANKYSGGHGNSACNWPGVGNRPPLVIIARKFIIHFKTNGAINDWGFKMFVVPVLAKDQIEDIVSNEPVSKFSHNYSRDSDGVNIYDRLYQEGIEQKLKQHNSQVELMERTIDVKNVAFNPWESAKSLKNNTDLAIQKFSARTHLPKQTLADIVHDLIIPNQSSSSVSGYDSSTAGHHNHNHSMRSTQTRNTKSVPFTSIEYNPLVENLWRDLQKI